jgi:MFS family permease
MQADADKPLAVFQRARARRLAYWNAAIHAFGGGLTGTTLIVYMAQEFGASRIGLGVSLILAARHIVGLLRLGAPALIGRVADRKRFCAAAYLISAAFLLALPLAAALGEISSSSDALWALVSIWCLYNLFEYFAAIALWSWLADLAHKRVRGRFLGVRERWSTLAEAAAMLGSGIFVWAWQKYISPGSARWVAYAIPAGLGACFSVAALVPLVLMPRAESGRSAPRAATLGNILAPFADGNFLGLLLFGCWFSFFNGVTQSAQNLYPIQVLGIPLFLSLAAQTAMRSGQWAISPSLGGLADRFGNRPVMITSQLIAASGLLFYLMATPESKGWYFVAWAAWIAYAGLNVCLPNLMLNLSPGRSNAPYIAAYYTVSGLCYAASTIVGGQLHDHWQDASLGFLRSATQMDYYQFCFLFGWIARSLAVLFILPINEVNRESIKV